MRIQNQNQVSSTNTTSAEALKKAKQNKVEKTDSEKSNAVSANVGKKHLENSEISSKAKDMAQAHSLAAAAPDVREDKVAALKKQIAEGKYKVNAEAVADKMIKEHMDF